MNHTWSDDSNRPKNDAQRTHAATVLLSYCNHGCYIIDMQLLRIPFPSAYSECMKMSVRMLKNWFVALGILGTAAFSINVLSSVLLSSDHGFDWSSQVGLIGIGYFATSLAYVHIGWRLDALLKKSPRVIIEILATQAILLASHAFSMLAGIIGFRSPYGTGLDIATIVFLSDIFRLSLVWLLYVNVNCLLRQRAGIAD